MEYIPAKTILSGYADNNAWFGTHYNMNLYKGCCHGCIYCDSRSECYRVERFDEVRAKENALALLERDLKSKRRKGNVGMGAMSDPYNPFEEKLKLTRGALELIHHYGFGVAVATKSDLVARDLDLIKAISKHSPVIIKLTVTAAEDALCEKVEPHAPKSSQRLAALKRLTDSGIYAGILLMPLLPFIEDTMENVSAILRLAHENGARFLYPGLGVTLRANQREYFYQKLDEHFPLMRQKYEAFFGNAYSCGSAHAKTLYRLISGYCEKAGIAYAMKAIIASSRAGYDEPQVSLFDLL